MIRIGRAALDDCETVSRILRASIADLCLADHGNDPDTVARWTTNKTPEHIAQWIDDPGCTLLLALRDGVNAGIGGFRGDGEILLNYVAPGHRFQGVSRALLDHMELALREGGCRLARLTSTETAHRFYREAGWVDVGPPETLFGVKGYPMEKTLGADEQPICET